MAPVRFDADRVGDRQAADVTGAELGGSGAGIPRRWEARVKWLKILKIGAAIAKAAGQQGVAVKDIPLDKIVGLTEKTIKDAKKLKPVPVKSSTGE